MSRRSVQPGEPGEPPPPLLSRTLQRFGLEDFPEYDPVAEVETPRSLAACASEGIRSQDLTFAPLEAFLKPGVSSEMAQLRAEYFEARRQDLLALARRARADALGGTPAPHSMSPRADPGSQYRHAFEWFKQKLYELNLQIIPTNEDWSKGKRTEEFKRVDHYAAYRDTSLSGGAGPAGIPAFLASSTSLASFEGDPEISLTPPGSPGSRGPAAAGAVKPSSLGSVGPAATTGNSWWATNSSTWRSATSEEALHDMLAQIRAAPGSDWREFEAARRTEDTFGSSRQLDLKALDSRHDNEDRLLDKRIGSLKSSFGNLKFDQQRRGRYREIRELMSPPQGFAGNSSGQVRAKEVLVKMMEDGEASRQEYFESRIRKQQALEKHIDLERHSTKTKFAQMTLEDRVRWRHNYGAVEERLAEERVGVLEDFRRKQAQLDHAGARAAEVGALKNEVMNLRRTHRMFDEYRRRRKDEHEDAVRRAQLRELGEKRIERTGGRISVPASRGQMLLSATSPTHSAGSSLPTSPAATASPSAAAPAETGVPDFTDMILNEPLSPKETRWMQSVFRRAKTASSPAKRLGRSASTPNFPRQRLH